MFYFQIQKSSLIMPPLFHHFFLTNFKLDLFLIKNQALIREEAIHFFVRNMNKDTKAHYIKQIDASSTEDTKDGGDAK